jgi:L-alanine-DL-glutamate epimerase-like enolase superfamily enzyme
MKISKVEAFPIKLQREDAFQENRYEHQNTNDFGDYIISRNSWTSIYPKHLETVLVRIETDTGIVGWGEAFSPVARATTATIVEDICRTVIMGHDPHDVEYLWYRTYSAMRERGHGTGFYIDALSGVDQALWDIIGKALDKPVYKLIGGGYRDKVKAYSGFGGVDPQRMSDQAAAMVELGYVALKLHIRLPNPETLAVVSAVRDRVGPDIELMVDVHTTKDVSEAIQLGRGLEKLGCRWLESPVAPEDPDGHAEIARALDMQVASGEWLRTSYEWRPWLEKRAMDVPMPDIGRTGISEGKRIAMLCDLYNLPMAPHVGAGCILAIAAGIHVSMAAPRLQIMEHSHHAMPLKSSFADSYPDVVDGHFVLADKPGLGVDINEAKVRALADK